MDISRFWNEKHIYESVLRIRIDFNADSDPAFSINAVRFRIQGFNDQKLEKIYSLTKFIFFGLRNFLFEKLLNMARIRIWIRNFFKVGTGIEVSFHNTDDK